MGWYGWAPHDQRATGSAPRNHGKNLTLVAALRHDGLHTPWLIEGAMEGAMETATFAWSIAEQLAPTLRPGQVVVVDKSGQSERPQSRQHSPCHRYAIAARGCELLFLPPSSPDFTPIEQAFSKIKAILDSQSVKTVEESADICGYDAHKVVKFGHVDSHGHILRIRHLPFLLAPPHSPLGPALQANI